jgi:hypothetical protein
LPPEIAACFSAKEQQAAALAQQQKLALDPITKGHFDQVKAGARRGRPDIVSGYF